ncbi:MAG: hypothetical protein U0361_17225 [Nitrospiraceae bacterium]
MTASETLRVQKERRELEYQAQVEREKQTLAPPTRSGWNSRAVVPPMLPGQQVPSADQRAPLTGHQDAEEKPFTGELLRAKIFQSKTFAQFSILQGVKSRLKQFGYEFFDANANTFSRAGCPCGTRLCHRSPGFAGELLLECAGPKFQSELYRTGRTGRDVGVAAGGGDPGRRPNVVEAEKTIRARLSTLLSGSNYTCRWRVSGR